MRASWLNWQSEKGSLFWKTVALSIEARHLALTGEPAKALPMATSARNAFEATEAKFLAPLDLSVIASIYAALGKFDDARRCIAEAMNAVETNKERWFEADVVRTAGEVELEVPRSRIQRKPKGISSVRWLSPASSKRNHGNSAPQ